MLTQRRQFSKIAFTNARRRPTSAAPRPYLLATTTTGGESFIVLVLAPQWTDLAHCVCHRPVASPPSCCQGCCQRSACAHPAPRCLAILRAQR